MGVNNAEELAKSLDEIGGHLHIKFEDAITAMHSLHEEYVISRIFAPETGTLGLIRNIQVKEWCIENDVEWMEFANNGVIKLVDRDLWKKKRDSRMRVN